MYFFREDIYIYIYIYIFKKTYNVSFQLLIIRQCSHGNSCNWALLTVINFNDKFKKHKGCTAVGTNVAPPHNIIIAALKEEFF